MDDMYFYHSFPRGFKNDHENEIITGLKTIESMAKVGLLLTPEKVRWDKHLGVVNIIPQIILQRRICFTLLNQNELIEKHAIEYGRFALEFDAVNLRLLGAMPMFYVPTKSKISDNIEFIPSQVLVIRLLRNLNLLQELKANEEIINGVKGAFGLLYPTESGDKDPELKNYLLREWRITCQEAHSFTQ
jgi:hypothetical protein